MRSNAIHVNEVVRSRKVNFVDEGNGLAGNDSGIGYLRVAFLYQNCVRKGPSAWRSMTEIICGIRNSQVCARIRTRGTSSKSAWTEYEIYLDSGTCGSIAAGWPSL
jgi:hypothetical protein